MQAAGNKEPANTGIHCLFPAESYTFLHSFPPTPVVCLHFHFLHRTWLSIGDWTYDQPLNDDWGTITAFLSSVHFPLLRLLHFFFNIFLTAFLLACMLNSGLRRLHTDKRKRWFDLCSHLYVKIYSAYLILTRMATIKKIKKVQKISSVGEDVKKLEPVWDIKWYSHWGTQYCSSSKN